MTSSGVQISELDLIAFGALGDPALPAADSAMLSTPLDPLAKECPDDLPCRVYDADLWFAETPAELERAKQHCADCPARLACLTGALERREPWGVWGGEIFERGMVVPRKRPRGRPRKGSEGSDVSNRDGVAA